MLDRKQKLNFWKGTFSLTFAVILTKILGVMFKVPLSYLLSDEGMGYFNAAYSIYGFFYILSTAGVPKAVTLLISEYNAEHGYDLSGSILSTGVKFFLKIGIALMTLNLLLSPLLSKSIGSPRSLHTMLVIAPAIVFSALSGVLRGFLNAKNMLTGVALSQLVEGAVKLIFGIVFAFIGKKIGAPIYTISALAVMGITMGSAFGALCLYIEIKKKCSNIFRQNIVVDRKNLQRKMLKIALPISLSSSVISFTGVIDMSVMMRRIISTGVAEKYAIAIYGNYSTLALPMFNLVIALITPIAVAFLPQLANCYYGRNSSEDFVRESERLLMLGAVISSPFVCIFYLYSFDLLDVLFSVNSAAMGAELLIFLSPGVFLLAILTITNTILEARGKIKTAVLSLLIGSAVKIVTSYYLMGIESLSVSGAPLGSVISYFVSLLISLSALEMSGVKLRFIRSCAIVLPIAMASFTLPYLLIYRRNILGASFYSMALACAVSLLVYFGALYVPFLVVKKRMLIKNAQNV